MSAKFTGYKSKLEVIDSKKRDTEEKLDAFIQSVNALTGRYFDRHSNLALVQQAMEETLKAQEARKRKLDDFVSMMDEMLDKITTEEDCPSTDTDSPVLRSSSVLQKPAKRLAYEGLSQLME